MLILFSFSLVIYLSNTALLYAYEHFILIIRLPLLKITYIGHTIVAGEI
jgi:hypothetical protein